MGYTANYLDVILVGATIVVAIVYLFVKGELKKW